MSAVAFPDKVHPDGTDGVDVAGLKGGIKVGHGIVTVRSAGGFLAEVGVEVCGLNVAAHTLIDIIVIHPARIANEVLFILFLPKFS